MSDHGNGGDAAVVLHAARTDDALGTLVGRVDALVAEREWAYLPALPGDPELHVTLPADRMGLEEFIEVAQRTGTVVLYRDAEVLTEDQLGGRRRLAETGLDDSDEDRPGDPEDDAWAEALSGPRESSTNLLTHVADEDIAGEGRSLLDAAGHLVGSTTMVRVGFPYRGVIHTWVATAPWRAVLRRAIETQLRHQPRFPDRTGHGGGLEAGVSWGAVPLWPQEKIEELAGQWALLPAVRELPPHHNTYRVECSLQDHEVVGSLLASHDRTERDSAQRALALAWEQVGRDREAAERDLRGRLDELAAKLAAGPEFRAHDLVADRRRDAERFLRETSGYGLSRTLATELEARARRLRPRTQSTTTLF